MLLKVGFPLIITGTLFLTVDHFFSGSDGGAVLVMLGIMLVISFILSLVVAIVGCHRIFLLDSSVSDHSNLLSWTGNEIAYMGWWLFIGLCTCFVAFPIVFILIPFLDSSLDGAFENQTVFFSLMGFINIPICYVVSRWSLVLPSSAIDLHGKSLTWSWGLSSGNGWRLTLLIGLLPFILDIMFSLLPEYDSIVFTFFHGVVWLTVGVVEIGLLSLSYKHLVGNEALDVLENENVS